MSNDTNIQTSNLLQHLIFKLKGEVFAFDITQVGALADSVQEVVDLKTEEIEPPPRIGMNMESRYIKGMGKHKDEFIILREENPGGRRKHRLIYRSRVPRYA